MECPKCENEDVTIKSHNKTDTGWKCEVKCNYCKTNFIYPPVKDIIEVDVIANRQQGKLFEI